MTATLTAPRPGAPPHTDKVLVNYEVRDGLAIITLNDPPANTYTYEMMLQLDAAILKARMADDVHVIILRGKGEKFFSATTVVSDMGGAPFVLSDVRRSGGFAFPGRP